MLATWASFARLMQVSVLFCATFPATDASSRFQRKTIGARSWCGPCLS